MPPFDVSEGDPFGPHNLPYGVFSRAGSDERTVGVRLGDHVLDAGAAARALDSPYAALLARPSLNPLLAAGRVRPVVHARLPIAEAGRGHGLLDSGEVTGKVVLQVR